MCLFDHVIKTYSFEICNFGHSKEMRSSLRCCVIVGKSKLQFETKCNDGKKGKMSKLDYIRSLILLERKAGSTFFREVFAISVPFLMVCHIKI